MAMVKFFPKVVLIKEVTQKQAKLVTYEGDKKHVVMVDHGRRDLFLWREPSTVELKPGLKGELYIAAEWLDARGFTYDEGRCYVADLKDDDTVGDRATRPAVGASVDGCYAASTADVHGSSQSSTLLVEFLRTGTPHGQRLSPATEYLALYGDDPPETVKVALTQDELDGHLEALDPGSDAQAAVRSLEAEAWQLLEPVAERHRKPDDEWTHIHLRVNANELAMVPFELAAPTAGAALLQQQNPRISLTREVRLARRPQLTWPCNPLILYAWAPGEGGVPHEEHRQAIIEALDPWLGPDPATGSADLKSAFRELPNASLDDIAAALDEAPFTHVHILAHGRRPEGGGRCGLKLRDEQSYSGEQVATALTARHVPTVVTLMSCWGAGVGNPLVPGASILHDLNRARIPFVVGNQLPLTKSGTSFFAREFYSRVLVGEDPRVVLTEIRRRLSLQRGAYRDWASLVAYAHLPDALGRRLADAQLKAIRAQLEAATEWSSYAIEHGLEESKLDAVSMRTDEAIRRLTERLDDPSFDPQPMRAEHRGLLGSAFKRKAELMFKRGLPWRKALVQSRDWYRQAVLQSLDEHWAAAQLLCLEAVLEGSLEAHRDTWTVAEIAAKRSLGNDEQRVWVRGSLAELYLLEPLTVAAKETDYTRARYRALAQVESLMNETRPGDFPLEPVPSVPSDYR